MRDPRPVSQSIWDNLPPSEKVLLAEREFSSQEWAPLDQRRFRLEPETYRSEVSIANVGATVMGRNMFGGHPGPWSAEKPWDGWWGPNPPFHHPVFVLTHHARAPLEMEGGTTFHFVTDGTESALAQARRAAGGKDVALGGGAKAVQQYLKAGLVDEMEINLVPTLLERGERLFDGVSDLHGLRLVRTVAAPTVTHLKFART